LRRDFDEDCHKRWEAYGVPFFFKLFLDKDYYLYYDK